MTAIFRGEMMPARPARRADAAWRHAERAALGEGQSGRQEASDAHD